MSKQAVKTESNLPARDDVSRLMREDAGQGISGRPEDNIVPQLKVLQPMSPEVMDGDERIEGAKPGDFLVGNALVSGREGLWFQPCFVDHKLFEFTPLERGGGFVAEHPVTRDELGNAAFTSAGDPQLPEGFRKVSTFKYESRDGNSLLHYRQLAGFVWPSGVAYVISFKSTGHTTMRLWMTKAARSNPYEDGRQRSLFSHLYRLTTSRKSNSKGTWFSLEVGDAVCLDPEISPEVTKIVSDPFRAYVMGRALNAAFSTGEKTSPTPEREVREESQDEIPF